MSTRGFIGTINADGVIKVIYNHSDSYVDYLGRVLFENVKTTEQVESILNMKYCSFLLTDEDRKERLADEHVQSSKYLKELYTNLDAVPNTNLYMERVNKNEDTTRVYKSVKGFKQGLTRNYGIEYAYLFNGHEWLYLDVYHGDGKLELLADGIKKVDEENEEGV